MKKHAIYFYWLLLLTPTIVIGVTAVWALKREEQRAMETQVRAAEQIAGERAALFADNVRSRLELLQLELMNGLTAIDESEVDMELADWDRTEPLVRNAFVWSPSGGLRLPDPGQPENREQARFIMRYEPLFSGRVSWESTIAGRLAEGSPTGPSGQPANASDQTADPANTVKLEPPNAEGRFSSNKPKQQPQREPQKQQQSSDQQKESQSQTGTSAQPSYMRPDVQQGAYTDPTANASNAMTQQALNFPIPGRQDDAPHRKGWISWFSGNRLHLLGWAQMSPGGRVRGIELESMAILSRLYETPLRQQNKVEGNQALGNAVFALIDENGQTMFQDGVAPDEASAVDAVALIGAVLPHWQVRCSYFPDLVAGRSYGRSIVVFGGLLVAIFVASILAGGSLLLWQAQRNAEEAMQKTSFVSNVSHELKTPLTSIRMYAELLGSGKVKERAKEGKYLSIIESESQRLGRLVNNVLDFSRLEQGRKKYHLEPLALTDCIAGILDSQALRIREVGMEPDYQIPDDEVTAMADRDALEQIMINLIDNACKYAATGGKLDVQLCKAGNHAEIKVLDRGPGISENQLEKVFEKFHRVNESLTRDQDGVGLGLSITRRLARDMSGSLQATARDGGGAAFILKLPLVEE